MVFKADVNSVVNPKSICIVGASESSLFVRNLVNNLEFQGFTGSLYMVNPKYESVFGYNAYSNVFDIPFEIDNAILLIPAKSVLDAFRQCVQKHVKSVTIITSGFAENGRKEGGKIQSLIKEIALESNTSVCGPNCFGTINTHGKVANFAEKLPGKLKKGDIGIVMQSGGLVNAVLNLAYNRGVDFSYLISSGNEAVLESSDYFRFMIDDKETNVICAFIEGIKNKKAFMEAVTLANESKKPIILIKIGSSPEGSRCAFRHTGSITGSDSEFNSICKEKGIIRVEDLDDLIETASLFSKVYNDRFNIGRRIGVITVSGGGASLISDIGTEEGFEFPELSENTVRSLAKIVPEFGFVANPLDMTAQVFGFPSDYIKCAEYMINEINIDVIAFGWTLGIPKEPSPVATIIEGLSDIIKKTNKLCIMFSVSNMGLSEWGMDLLRKCNIPFIQGGRRVFKVLNALIEYKRFIRQMPG